MERKLFRTHECPTSPLLLCLLPHPPKDTLISTGDRESVECELHITPHALVPHLSRAPLPPPPSPKDTLLSTFPYLAIEKVWGVSFTLLRTHSSPPPLSMQRADARRLAQPTN